MPKFQIELELSSINDRLVLTNFDSSENSIGGLTFNENLLEEENGLYNLTFSMQEKVNEISLERLITVGRPLWLYTYNPDKAIRMVISSFSVIIGPENNVFSINAQDYASYAFSKNNAGLTLNTIEDEDFLDWLDLQTPSTTTITNIANYVLQRGWLQKTVNSTTSGWTLSIVGDNKIINLDVSGSNTYNAILELANLSNMQVEFNYENETIIFTDRESSTLKKNYTLKRDFNLQNFEVSYSGDNLYSIFYVDAAEDEFGLRTLLSDDTLYRDNFLFDFNYFRSKDLLSASDLTAIENEINVELKKINEKLIGTEKVGGVIQERENQRGFIREARSKIESIAELLAAPEQFNDYAQRYLDLQSQFFRPSLGTKQVTRTENFKVLNILWNDLRPNFVGTTGINFSFPIRFNYFGINYVQETANTPVVIGPYGFSINIFFEPNSGRIPWPSASANPRVYLAITNEGDIEFDIRRFRITSVDVEFDLTIVEDGFEFIYPYFTLLNEFDGQSAITKELERLQADVDLFEELRDEDLIELQCLIDNDPSDPECEEFLSEDQVINDQRIVFLQTRLEDYKAAIGEELPNGAFTPGKFTLILDTFEKYRENYERPELQKTIMDKYREAIVEKQNFWYDLKENRQHLFLEGYYENDFEDNIVSLKAQAEASFNEHNKPLEDFNLTYIDLSDIVGIDIQNISAGDFVELKEEKLKVIASEESQLKVASISRVLRDKGNISLIIFRYNMINRIIERIITQNQ